MTSGYPVNIQQDPHQCLRGCTESSLCKFFLTSKDYFTYCIEILSIDKQIELARLQDKTRQRDAEIARLKVEELRLQVQLRQVSPN